MTQLAEIQRKLTRGELAAALQDVEGVLRDEPDDVDALYLQAVTLRYLSRHDAALAVLAHIRALQPAHARAYQEEGHNQRDVGAHDLALRAYSAAINLNPALMASFKESIRLLEGQNRHQESAHLSALLHKLEVLPKPLVAVTELIAQNRLLMAEERCRAFLREHPEHVEGMRLLADIGVRLGVLDDAEFLLESAAHFAPDNLPVRMSHIQVLRKRQKFADALHAAQNLLDEHPQNLQVKSICAIELMQTGEYDRATEMLDEVLQAAPGDARTLVTYGHALKTRGDTSRAVEKYRSAAASEPLHGESYYALANLKTYRFTQTEIAHMQYIHSDPGLGFMDRVYVNFALAKALEDQGEYRPAFAHYQAGNALKKSQSRYDAGQIHDELTATQALCSEGFFSERAGYGCDAPDPIFIVGLPRAGSTLLEQILSSHSQIDGTLELPNVLSLTQRLRRRAGQGGFPAVIAELSADECAEFGEAYLRDTRIHRAGAPLFIDKMPNNFRHIGLIKLMLPNAKIIDARREPMACCFSGYKQLFAEGQEFSYDLSDIGRYYRDYEALMSHWDAALPGFVLRVQHEDVVADLEGQVRRLLAFCDLPFETSCLSFYETERSVRTPSSEQVRQPIFSDGLEQWRHFEPWLEPLRAALAV